MIVIGVIANFLIFVVNYFTYLFILFYEIFVYISRIILQPIPKDPYQYILIYFFNIQ